MFLCVILESMVTGVTQKPQEEEEEEEDDEETGEKFEFDDSEDEKNAVENKESGTPHVEAEISGSSDINALYCQSMKHVTHSNQPAVNGGTPAGLEEQNMPTHPHTHPGLSA